MKKRTYYVSVQDGMISQSADASPWEFEITASDEDVIILREYFDQMHSEDWSNFFRAHVPALEYHYDSSNDKMDELRKDIYSMLYRLGNEETKSFISEHGLAEMNSVD
ncbi:hydrolase [Bacillus swezeyi]|uniref:Hydrolase n=1 Tax=Bacillus swezeyi TaxID=1925020 RepID=A0A5M8RKW0_9BACI|nr:hydrolase [Bacillus swezeyi]KAA6448501.1 hydrolase [Bacillus swezeyi]KAA6481617.1 hydrolase [Bacillus swezeyi]TYS34809.1 hydrolase [Bacillus swezeyi]